MDAAVLASVFSAACAGVAIFVTHRVYSNGHNHSVLDRIELAYRDLSDQVHAFRPVATALAKKLQSNSELEIEIEGDLPHIYLRIRGTPLPPQIKALQPPVISRNHQAYPALTAASLAARGLLEQTRALYQKATDVAREPSRRDELTPEHGDELIRSIETAFASVEKLRQAIERGRK